MRTYVLVEMEGMEITNIQAFTKYDIAAKQFEAICYTHGYQEASEEDLQAELQSMMRFAGDHIENVVLYYLTPWHG